MWRVAGQSFQLLAAMIQGQALVLVQRGVWGGREGGRERREGGETGVSTHKTAQAPHLTLAHRWPHPLPHM